MPRPTVSSGARKRSRRVVPVFADQYKRRLSCRYKGKMFRAAVPAAFATDYFNIADSLTVDLLQIMAAAVPAHAHRSR
ncbi:MAG: hypothetical protein OHK0029_29800 [Armatimonadaceae bacterium]